MNRSTWGTDAGLLTELSGVLGRVEQPPADVLRQAREAFAWRSITAQLAELEYDSLIDDDEPDARARSSRADSGQLAGVRGSGAERVLRFRHDGVVARLALDGARRLVGRLEPASFRAVEVRQQSGTTLAEVDTSGNFLVERLRRGLISLRCLPADPDGPVLETEWVAI